jgi:hypothetical protein
MLTHMTSKPRTIDNLGLDASIRYAKDKELFEAKFIEESQFVSLKSTISVSKPYVFSEFDQLFATRKTVLWALFSPPPAAHGSLFSYQLVPSMGDPDTEEDPADLLDGEEERDSSDQKKREKQLIEKLLSCIEKMDKSLRIINSRRNQYQRG